MTEPSKVERGLTDASLRTERNKADSLVREREAIEQHADNVVDRARDKADAVVGAARDKADEADPSGVDTDVVASRKLEDRVLHDERAKADQALEREREQSAHLMVRLLPFERERTDRSLLTERARSDDDLARQNNFLAMATHDLRSLLGGIVLTTQAMAARGEDVGESAATLADAKRIERYAARMNRLIGDLSDVASIDVGRLAVTLVQGDLRLVLHEAVEAFTGTAAAAGVTLHGDFGDDALVGSFDGGRMLQVFANLITNAIKFTPRGGAVTLQARAEAGGLRVSCIDNGCGVPTPMLASIFERFWQVNKGDRRGVGLGLYISKSIVEAHGGRIDAESVVGAGSTFTLTLPASS